MIFTESDYERIHELTFRDGYPGYKPATQESPNGDGVWDEAKRYAHVAPKYKPNKELMEYFWRGFHEAQRVFDKLKVPLRLDPDPGECCLRILDYPPGAGSALHTDFDLFTLQLYRDRPEGFKRSPTLNKLAAHVEPGIVYEDDRVSSGIHWGEMAEVAGFRRATEHRVDPLPVRQRSIVFFALPARSAALITAGEWLDERYARSRR